MLWNAKKPSKTNKFLYMADIVGRWKVNTENCGFRVSNSKSGKYLPIYMLC